ncbi:MAG: hypothetical protein KGI36_20565, partial [Burkholderiales bacterium]|nr:hypothetical protein [Burkholderiales bacterium]
MPKRFPSPSWLARGRIAALAGAVLGPALALLALEGAAWAWAAPQRGWGGWALLALPSFALATA